MRPPGAERQAGLPPVGRVSRLCLAGRYPADRAAPRRPGRAGAVAGLCPQVCRCHRPQMCRCRRRRRRASRRAAGHRPGRSASRSGGSSSRAPSNPSGMPPNARRGGGACARRPKPCGRRHRPAGAADGRAGRQPAADARHGGNPRCQARRGDRRAAGRRRCPDRLGHRPGPPAAPGRPLRPGGVCAPAARGIRPLENAIGAGSTQMVDLHAEHGIVPQALWTYAACGRLDLVQACFDTDGRLRPDAATSRANPADFFPIPPRNPATSDPEEIMAEAFVYACQHGRTDVVRWFLDRRRNDRRGPPRGRHLQHAAGSTTVDGFVHVGCRRGATRATRPRPWSAASVSTAPPSALTFATEVSTSSVCQNTDQDGASPGASDSTSSPIPAIGRLFSGSM